MENQKTKIISIASIIALALTLVTATFAYFMAQTGEGKSTDIKINANTVDTLTFEAESAISLNLNQENFASGKGNQTGTTFAKAMLTANNKTNTATEHYYMYLNISENTFTYTQDANTPEILLTIKDTSGNEIKSITGLTYKTNVTDGKGASISGFDITTKTDLITLFDNREITTTSSKTEEWNITVTFVNYNANQAGNAGKSFSSKVMIQKEEIVETIAMVCSSGQTLSSCIMAMNGKDNTLYYHDSTLDNGAGDNSYRYAGGDYVLTEAGKATGATTVIGYNTALIDFYCNGTKQYFGSYCGSSDTHYYLINGDTTQYQSYNEALNVSVEKGYLTKDNVKNFVCFGSNASPCPDANLFRIIGVFGDQTKVIRAKSVGNKQWHSSQVNTWSSSSLNTYLNGEYLTSLGTIAEKIATTTWKVGGGLWSNIVTSVPKTAYQYEVGSSASTTTVDKKIGLMYVTDYYYSASPSAWTLVGYNESDATKDYRAAKTTNWLYLGSTEWTISRNSDRTINAFNVNSNGNVINGNVTTGSVARPSFNLESSVKYVSGSGSMSDPVRVN